MVAKRAAAVAVVTTVVAIAAVEVERRVVGVKALVARKAARQVAAVKVTAVAVAAYPAVRVRMVLTKAASRQRHSLSSFGKSLSQAPSLRAESMGREYCLELMHQRAICVRSVSLCSSAA